MPDSGGAGQTLLADDTYDSDALRQNVADRDAWVNAEPLPGRVNVPVFIISPCRIRFRDLVERFFRATGDLKSSFRYGFKKS